MLNRTRLNIEYSSAAIFVFFVVQGMKILLFECQWFEMVPLERDIFRFLFAQISRPLFDYFMMYDFYFILSIKRKNQQFPNLPPCDLV